MYMDPILAERAVPSDGKRCFEAKFRNVLQDEYINFKQEECIFLVSVGKANFEGEALKAQLIKIKSAFKSCMILTADTLQRYNIMADNCKNSAFSEKEAEELSIKYGSEWIENNKPYFDKILNPDFYKISLWNEWIKINEYEVFKHKVVDLLGKSNEYQNAMNDSVEEYTSRGNRDKAHYSSFCEKYLMEECGVMLMLADKGFNYIIYPGSQTKILSATQQQLINGNYSGRLNWIAVRLDKAKK